MPSEGYAIFRQAILSEKQVSCIYDGHPRELRPVILGFSKGEEKVLAYQIGGTSSGGLPPEGQWKCLRVANVRNATIHNGLWREGEWHRKTQTCVENVDVDINVELRKRRRRA